MIHDIEDPKVSGEAMLNPIKPISTVPNSQTAAGTGTADTVLRTNADPTNDSPLLLANEKSSS